MSDHRQDREVKARKPHQCDWCHETLAVGELHWVSSGRWDGQMFRHRKHIECALASEKNPCGPSGCDGCEHCFIHYAHPRGGYTTTDRDGNTVTVIP